MTVTVLSMRCYSSAKPLSLWKGQHNDARMNIALVMTAVKLGATAANKVEVTQLLKDAEGKIEGARVKDNLTGDEWEVKARVLSISQAVALTNLTPFSGCHQCNRALL
jgi:hypothetical protein